MSPVRRRALRRGGKKGLLPLLLGAALLAAAGGWYLLSRRTLPPPQPRADTSAVLSDRGEEELARIAISNPYGAPYALVRDASGDWRMEGEESFPLRPAMAADIVNNAALIAVEETVTDLAGQHRLQAADFGLGEDAVRVEVTFADKTRLAFRIGSAVPGETPAYYFMLEGDSRVYTVSADVCESYTNERMALHQVADPALKGELVDGIAFSGNDPLALERREDGWYMTAPFAYPLSDTAMESLLQKLEGLRFAQYVGAAEDTDLAACGLYPPLRTLTLTIAPSVVTGYDDQDRVTGEKSLPGYQLAFGLGETAGDEVLFYCLYRGAVYKATVFSAGFLRSQSYEELLLAAPFNAPTNDLSRLVWEEGAQTLAYDIFLQERVDKNNALETDENGSVLYDVVALRQGEQVSSDDFLYAYRALLQLRATDPLPADYRLPDTPPLLRVTLTRSASTRQVALYPCDPLHDAVAVDGVARFRVEKGWAAGIAWP